MLKPVPAYWILLVGLLAVAVQLIPFYARFGHWNTDVTYTDYLLFFLVGSIGGGILVYFLTRLEMPGANPAVTRAVYDLAPE